MERPSGTVTLLEGLTRLLQNLRDGCMDALSEQRRAPLPRVPLRNLWGTSGVPLGNLWGTSGKGLAEAVAFAPQ